MKIIAFPFHDWNKGVREGFRTRDGHILEELARRHDVDSVVVVNRPRPQIERWFRRGRSTADPVASRQFRGVSARVSQVADRTFTVDSDTPDVIAPVRSARDWWFDVFGRESIGAALRWAFAELDVTGSPAVAWTPTVAHAVVASSPSRIVFDSLDNWLIHPVLRRSAAKAEAAYAKLLPAADAVFVAAPRSAEVLGRWRSDIRVLPNGVDSDVFRASTQRPLDLPTGTVIGYAGKLAQRIDTELVVAVAERMPELQFVFVGPILDGRSIRPLRDRANIHLLGDKPYTALPAYVQRFDVAWIPHRVGEGETGGDPIKLYEYWAAGRPVVSAPIDGLERWISWLRLVSSAEEACSAIREMLVRPVVPLLPPEREWRGITDVLVDALRGTS